MQVIKSRIFYYKSGESPYQYNKSCENPYQVLQVTCMGLNVQWGSYNKILITIVPSYTRKKYHSFVAIGIVTRGAHS